jgi:Cytochrome P450
VFTPRRVNALEPKIREFCARSLDPLVGGGGFDFIRDLGAQMPMRTIGMLLGIPEQDQEAIRDRIDEGLRLNDSAMPDLEEYIDWRAEHPSDDLMTELLHAEFEDETGARRRLTRAEVLEYVNLLAAAGNETTRLIGWTGKVLADDPDQRKEIVDDRSLVPEAIDEVLRYESPSPVQARYVTRDVEHYGEVVPEGSVIVLLTASGNRDERKFPDADRFDIQRKIDHHLAFGYGIHFCLGAALARLEGRIALDEVLKRFPSWEVDRDNAVQARTSRCAAGSASPCSRPPPGTRSRAATSTPTCGRWSGPSPRSSPSRRATRPTTSPLPRRRGHARKPRPERIALQRRVVPRSARGGLLLARRARPLPADGRHVPRVRRHTGCRARSRRGTRAWAPPLGNDVGVEWER